MRRKGFTLIELLAVLVILGVIALVVFPNVTSSIKKSKEQGYQQQVNLIVDNARRWGLDHNDELSEIKNLYITIDDLKREGYIANKEVKDPRNDTIMNGCIVISYSNNYQQYIYEYNERPCSEIRQNYLVDLTDNYVENGSGLYRISADEYRYRGGCTLQGSAGSYSCNGTDPVNNYISIGGQKYRIIAIDSQGIKVQTQSKLATNIPFDVNNNNRNNANNTFCQGYGYCGVYAAVSGTFTAGNKSGTVTQNSSLYDYLNNTGTDAEVVNLRNKAKSATWNIGAVVEGSNVAISTIKSQEARNTATFKMGLMNVSDYIQASLDSSCQADPISSSANSKNCKNNNWLFDPNAYYPWTINTWTNTSGFSRSVWRVNTYDGHLNGNAYITNGVRPVAYLPIGTTYISGTGTESDPYIIS